MTSNSSNNQMRKLSFLGFNTGADGNGDPDEVKLDAEMEKVFGSQKAGEKFELAKLSSSGSNLSKERRKSEQSKTYYDPDSQSSTVTASPSSATAPKSPSDPTDDDDVPQVSERAAGYGEHYSDDDSETRHVKFTKQRKPDTAQVVDIPGDDSEEDNDERRKRKARHQHYKQKKFSLTEGQGTRRASGQEGHTGRRVSVQPEDATLEEADIDELTSHRSDDPRGLRRHKIQPTNPVRNGKDTANALPNIQGYQKKNFDRSPHEIFVQLDELTGTGEEREWKETARWIKYEEDVEEGSDRWGRPHVASLSFHSLLNLRRCLETGVVLMDLDERDLPAVAYRVVEQMVVEDLIHEDDKPTIMRALLLKHRHVNESSHSGFPFGAKRKYSSYTSLQNISDDKKPKIVPSADINGHSAGETKIDMRQEETYSSSQEDLKRAQPDSILKRIPAGAEATTVLVGAVDFLEQPTIAFVRLAEGIAMPNITEVPIPVRFLFILLGPKLVDLDYHEVGRSIATLMSNQHFHNIAYKAEDRRDLLSAINEFLDDSIVLPPGNWERHDLLSFDELKTRNEWIKARKSNAIKHKNKTKESQHITADEEKRLLAAAGGDDKKPTGPLEKTHRLWGGLINDMKRRWPMMKSDITDGLNTETLAATVFMYFASLSTAITFGGLASDKTFNLIGISETLISASIVGLIFHAIAGQPLVIIGTTGPLLLFDEALYQFCLANDYSFLTVRVYIGFWLGVIALVVSAFEGSVYVRLFTRFTQEIFSALITLIYIVETVMKLIFVYGRHPLLASYIYGDESAESIGNITMITGEDDFNTTLTADASQNATSSILQSFDILGPLNQPNTALFCTILTLGTFTLAYYLKIFRNSHFLGRNARRALGDFGVPIAIALFVCLDYMIPQVFTDKLSVPEGISPSDPTRRGWVIPMGPVPTWLPFACGVPALLVYILIFMETHISELIVDKPERGLKKGSGLHMDIVLLCFLNIFCGMLGMPWHCAATVRSVTHVSAVTIMSRTHAPGEAPKIIEVKEQRISGFIVSLMVGLSVIAAPLLRLIPMSVLFGVFLYMGIASMSGVQLFERLRLFFMPVKHHPQTPFVRRVPTWKMHVFTAIQAFCLAVLWAVKSSKFSLAFPFFLLMMVPLRQKMAKFYTQPELVALDGSQPSEGAEDEPDFYEQAPIPA